MIKLVLIPGTDGVKTIIPIVPFTTGFGGIMYHKSSGITYAARKSKSPFLLTYTRRPSPDVSQRGRGAAKSSLIRRRRELNIRKSSYRPSPAGLLAVRAPKVPIFC